MKLFRIRRYDRNYSRRAFLQSVMAGGAGAGVLMPLAHAISQDRELATVYPEELLSIDTYTQGRVSTGDEINADNVEHVKDLLEPAKYIQIREMGRRMRVVPTTTALERLMPIPYLEATLRNSGKARFDQGGNVVSEDGQPWIGGLPFPDAKDGLELFAGLTLSWGRHDVAQYAIKSYDLSAQGEVLYYYELLWVEMATVGRISLEPKPYLPAHIDKLRLQSVYFHAPNSVRGTNYLNIWPYDQNQFPELYGYLPQFKRVRQFPTSQRFEPLVPGSSLYLSDAWAAGDPLHTWGNYKVIWRGPMLAGVSGGWNHVHPNWEHETHGGPAGNTFWNTDVELVPEAIAVQAEPVAFPRAPVSRKVVWFDARTQLPLGMVSYDRRGDPYRTFDGAYALYETEGMSVPHGRNSYWSWGHVHAYDIQTRSMTRLEQVKTLGGGFSTAVDDPSVYDRFLTRSAMTRLGG